jgi:hypothetical protein
LLDAHYADAIPLSLLKTKQARITAEIKVPSRASLMSTTTSTQPGQPHKGALLGPGLRNRVP